MSLFCQLKGPKSNITPVARRYEFLLPFFNKRNQDTSEKIADWGLGWEILYKTNLQHLWAPESKDVLKNNNNNKSKQQQQQKHSDGDPLKGHRSKLKKLPTTKAGTISQLVLDYNSKYKYPRAHTNLNK